MLDSNLDDGKG